MIIAMAAFMIGSLMLQAPWLYQEMRFHPKLGRFGRAAPPIAGVAFGFGWTSCMGPVLTSIVLVAANADQVVGRGATWGVLTRPRSPISDYRSGLWADDNSVRRGEASPPADRLGIKFYYGVVRRLARVR